MSDRGASSAEAAGDTPTRMPSTEVVGPVRRGWYRGDGVPLQDQGWIHWPGYGPGPDTFHDAKRLLKELGTRSVEWSSESLLERVGPLPESAWFTDLDGVCLSAGTGEVTTGKLSLAMSRVDRRVAEQRLGAWGTISTRDARWQLGLLPWQEAAPLGSHRYLNGWVIGTSGSQILRPGDDPSKLWESPGYQADRQLFQAAAGDLTALKMDGCIGVDDWLVKHIDPGTRRVMERWPDGMPHSWRLQDHGNMLRVPYGGVVAEARPRLEATMREVADRNDLQFGHFRNARAYELYGTQVVKNKAAAVARLMDETELRHVVTFEDTDRTLADLARSEASDFTLVTVVSPEMTPDRRAALEAAHFYAKSPRQVARTLTLVAARSELG